MFKTIYILKRSNGMMGIYVDGKTQQHLVSNYSQKDTSRFMFDRLSYEVEKTIKSGYDYKIIFTTNEEEFKSNLPSLAEFLQGYN